MAELLEEYDFSMKGVKKRSKYPWDEWLDGKPRRLHRGVDFDTTAKSLRNRIYDMAKDRNLVAHVRIESDDKVVIQAEDPAQS